MKTVDFVVEGLDDQGGPSGSFLEVTEVQVLDGDGKEWGRFTRKEELWAVAKEFPYGFRLVALKTVGEPRTDLVGEWRCDEQASPIS